MLMRPSWIKKRRRLPDEALSLQEERHSILKRRLGDIDESEQKRKRTRR
jgi:hypothetical protein